MRALLFGVSIVLLLATSGCPRNQGNFTFTSADIGSNSNRGPLFGDGLGAPAEDDGTGGEETPREVVEPDVIRRAGNLLYILNQFRGLTIVDLDTDEILSRVPTYGFPRDLYLVGDRAYVLVGYAQNIEALDDNLIAVDTMSRLHVVDVSDPDNATAVSAFDIEGDLVDSRLVGDVLYAVTSEYFYYGFEDGGGGVAVPAGDVDASMRKQDSSSYITSVLIGDPGNIQVADELQFSGAGQVIHVSSTHAFVAAPDYQTDRTIITAVDIAAPDGSLNLLGTAEAPGYVADRFKLDAWDGTLRVVSTAFLNEREVYVTTIDLDTLETIVSFPLEGASVDSLFATRFDGPLAYIVTYFVVDPLFVVDLSDPANPSMRAPLTVPGFSIHIEPRGDRLIALGVDDTDNQRRVNVSLFDVSGDPVRLDTVSFGEDWSWSNAFSDVKAFTVFDDTIVVPFSGWAGKAGGYERLQFVSYTRDSLEIRGNVDLNGTILRSLEYGDDYFGVTTEQLARISGPNLDELEIESTVTLAENIADFAELGADRGAEIIARYDDGQTEVRIVDGNQDALSSVTVDVGSYLGVFARDGGAVIFGSAYDEANEYRGEYKVAVIAVDDDGIATLAGETTVGIEPFYDYYYYYYYGPFVGAAEDALFAPYPYPFLTGDRAFLVQDHLVLRGHSSDVDRALGNPFSGVGQPLEALAIVDLDTIAWTRTLGLGFARVSSVDQVGGLLYIGTKEDVTGDGNRPLCAHYIQTLDPITEALGEAANVPGGFLAYDPDTDVLVLQDFQWEIFGELANDIRTVSWDGSDSVEAIDDFDLPDSAGEVLASSGNLFYSVYATNFGIEQIVIDNTGELSAGGSIEVTNYYGQLLGVSGANVYATIGSQAVVRYDFAAEPELADLVQVMGSPLALRAGADQVYVPLGYFGLVTLPN